MLTIVEISGINFDLYFCVINYDFRCMMTKRKNILLGFILLLSSQAFSQVFDKYAGEFLYGGTGSRYLGMGNNAVSFVNDAFSVYWNPAGLAQTEFPQAVVMHNERFAGLVSYDFLAFSYPIDQTTTVGLGVLRNSVDNIPYTVGGWDEARNQREANFIPTYFNAAEYAFYGSVATTQFYHIPIGLSAKFLSRKYGTIASAWGIGLDFGTQIQNFYGIDNLSVGFIAHDLTSTYMSWSTGKTELITPTLETGVSYAYDLFFGKTTFAIGLLNRFENRKSTSQFNWGALSHDLKAGMEYSYNDKIGVRLGYNELKRLNAGVGLKVRALWLDYAFEQFEGTESLGNSHRISISFTLDRDRFQRPQ